MERQMGDNDDITPESHDPNSQQRATLVQLQADVPELRGEIAAYKLALNTGGEADAAGDLVKERLKALKVDYTDRLIMMNIIKNDAAAERRGGVSQMLAQAFSSNGPQKQR